MRVHDSNRLAVIKSYQNTSIKPMDKKLSKGQSTDQLEISSLAKEKLKQTIEDKADHSARIKELKNQIAAGTYQTDSEQIAGKLISVLKRENSINSGME